ncbi:phage holin family protein [Mucilaginibacter sp. L3T2-6]|uniref:phage holin family protein n=1 Tax=Mucilaginibacter sp. L3T2-6 TaxID=3062491 RepID=UPI00267644BE|nr:phage holin family protein [Mucilaginibacter sp. L3T2-6]MDO3641971.1 phage holin family protein [Mucilaginibacter sp. L3T2-6]MDV6214351.1 phage holin family protein [Mucilaginibacter sp. L3T2-6]
MKLFAERLLKTYDWHSAESFFHSLAPSFKYNVHIGLLIGSAVWVDVDKVFGLDNVGFVGLVAVFIMELVTGISAAIVRKESISSVKLSRFGLKLACYLVLIGASYGLSKSFEAHKKTVAAWAFDWLNVFLIVQIALENIISILENLAVISGKDKTAWINKIQNVFKSTEG